MGNGLSYDAGATLSQVNHIVVMYLENHSFDNLLGSWPGAEGLMNDAGASNGVAQGEVPPAGSSAEAPTVFDVAPLGAETGVTRAVAASRVAAR